MNAMTAHIRCYTQNYVAYLLWKPETAAAWKSRSGFLMQNKMIWETWGAIYRVERRREKAMDYERN